MDKETAHKVQYLKDTILGIDMRIHEIAKYAEINGGRDAAWWKEEDAKLRARSNQYKKELAILQGFSHTKADAKNDYLVAI